jgi:prepilin-type N-terminal cleavage/methylation domain-containing protein
MKRSGFTLLEVMVAAALLSIVTAGAMAAFIAQSRATNSEASTSQANDHAREGIRVISNDVRTAAAGLTPGSGGYGSCAAGTVPFDMGGALIACLPPVFRSASPIYVPGALTGSTLPGGSLPPCGGNPSFPGYQLTLGGGASQVVEPSTTSHFCPDDLVVLAVDDANPLFMIQSTPNLSSAGAVIPLAFAGTNAPQRVLLPALSSPWAGYGFDEGIPDFPPPGGGISQPMMLFGGASGAVLMDVGCTAPNCPAVAGGYTGTSTIPCSSAPNCWTQAYGIVPYSKSVDLYRSNLDFGTVAMPARLVQYSIQPYAANGTFVAPFVGANLVRSVVVPTPVAAGAGGDVFSVASTTVIVEGVIDMQVEFGFPDPANPNGGQLVYLNSAGLQAGAWPAPYTLGTLPGANAALTLTNCSVSPADPTVFSGVCYPNNGGSFNAVSQLRTVRLTLTVRAGAGTNATKGAAATTATSRTAAFFLQTGIQDLTVPSVEATDWGFNPTTPYVPGAVLPAGVFASQDGADYRQISTEIYVRNEGWSNNL